MNLRSQSACLINPRPRRTVPVSLVARRPAAPGTSERSGRSGAPSARRVAERENHCIPIDPRVNEAVE